MEPMKIAVVTEERAYGEAVCRSLHIGNRSFELSLFDGATFCGRWKQGGEGFRQGFDLILWDGQGLEQFYGGNLVWLTDRPQQTGGSLYADGGDGDVVSARMDVGGSGTAQDHDRSEMRFAIYKYAPSAVMVAEIFDIYAKLTGRRPAGSRPDRVDVFAFASWQGGCGCTSLAMAAAQELARFYGKKVLYLSLEGTASTARYMKVPEGMHTISEYLYHLEADRAMESGETGPFLEGYLIRDVWGVASFAPGRSCNPLAGISRAQMERFLLTLLGSGQFDAVVMDVGTGTGDPVRQALACADRLCLVYDREEPEREAGYRAFLRYGLPAGQPLLRVRNRRRSIDAPEPASQYQDSIPEVCISPRQHPQGPLSLEGAFGKDIHNLVEVCYNGIVTASPAS